MEYLINIIDKINVPRVRAFYIQYAVGALSESGPALQSGDTYLVVGPGLNELDDGGLETAEYGRWVVTDAPNIRVTPFDSAAILFDREIRKPSSASRELVDRAAAQ